MECRKEINNCEDIMIMKKKPAVSKMTLISIASIPLVMTLGNSMLIPVLPIIEKKIHISSVQASMMITCYSIASILLIPIAGFLSDKYGRKKIILPSLLIVMIGGLISGIASSKMDDPYITIIMGRLLQGIGAAGAAPIVLPLVGDLYKKDEDASAALGVIETSNTFGKVLSPIFGALLASFVWFLPFYVISILSAISFVLICFFVKISRKPKTVKVKDFLSNTKQIFKNEGRWLYTLFLAGGYVMFILFAIQVFLSNSLESDFNLHGVKKGFVLAIPLLLLCIASLVSSKVIKGSKSMMKNVILLGLTLQVISLLFFKEFSSIFPLVLVSSLNGIAIGMILPSLDALVTENIEKSQRGMITSFFSSARFIGVALGPLVMSVIQNKHMTSPKYIAAILSITLLVMVWKQIQVDD